MQMPKVQYSVTRLGAGQTQSGQTYPGGFDQTTPSLALQPGALRDCMNFECSQSGGYARIGGYERVDGRAEPSDAVYQIVQFSSFVTVPAVDDEVVQGDTGATGTIIVVNNSAGAYYIVVTGGSGSFNTSSVVFGSGGGSLTVTAANPQTITAGNPLTVSDSIIGTAINQTATITALLSAQYKAAAADYYRDLIGAVPGSGSILGVVAMDFNGVDRVYAFRANEAGTAVEVYKTSTNGWLPVPMLKIVRFTLGSVSEPVDGETLTQGSVTARIGRVMTQSGAYVGGTAVGDLVIYTPDGGSFVNGVATTSSGATVTISGAETAISLTPGTRFEFTKANFSGQLSTRRAYGCDGTNKCFEFDGEVLAPITTGLSPDTPSHITFHKNYLFISQGSSILYCGAGTPFMWGAVDGGGEIATGDIVNGMVTLPGAQTSATLAVFLRGNTSFLYGIGPTDFNYVSFNTGTGAVANSIQNLFETFLFDDMGVIRIKTTLNFGNFEPDTLTRNILPFIRYRRGLLTCSSLNREKSQYRVWFSDGFGLWLTSVNQQYLGAAVIYYPNPVWCTDDMDFSTSGMSSYFGSSDGFGYVYKMDTGTSFDGEPIDAHITLAWDAIRSPRILKRFRATSIEMQGEAYASISLGYMLGYGSPNIGQPDDTNYATWFTSSGNWDSGITWEGQFTWDGRSLIPTEADMTGTGENVQLTLRSGTDYIAPYTVNSVIYHYTMRRGMRG